jgi:hypothetical protein
MSNDKPIPFSYDEEDKPSSVGDLQIVRTLSAQLMKVMLEEDKLNEQLEEKRRLRKHLEEKAIPEAMATVGLQEIVLTSGLKVIIKNKVDASWPKDEARRERALDYIRRTGNDGLIKNRFTISYGAKSDAEAARLHELLQREKIAEHAEITNEKTVHSSTLGKFVRDQIEANQDPPLEDLGAYSRLVAVVKM